MKLKETSQNFVIKGVNRMKLIILCVDGLDPDYCLKLGFPKMKYETKLTIPKELYHNNIPHTLFIWASMLSGKINRYAEEYLYRKPPIINNIYLRSLRLPLRKFLNNHGINRVSKKKRQKTHWDINPINYNIENVTDNFDSIMWNIPTLSPECVLRSPTTTDMLFHSKRIYELWKIITLGMCFFTYDLSIAYCSKLDIISHLNLPLEHTYLDIHNHVKQLTKHRDIMLVSDHGCLNGEHTHHAYLGCTQPITATNILEVRHDIERIVLERS